MDSGKPPEAGANVLQVAPKQKVPFPKTRVGTRYICMNHLIQGRDCGKDDTTCPRKHLGHLSTVDPAVCRELVDYVHNTPHISWVPGAKPSGTS